MMSNVILKMIKETEKIPYSPWQVFKVTVFQSSWPLVSIEF